jgi:hypothetical protein
MRIYNPQDGVHDTGMRCENARAWSSYAMFSNPEKIADLACIAPNFAPSAFPDYFEIFGSIIC